MLPILTMSGARSTFVTSLPRCAKPLHTAEPVPWSMACPQSIMPARICRGMHRHDNSWLGLCSPCALVHGLPAAHHASQNLSCMYKHDQPCVWGLQVTEAEVAQHFADCGDIMDCRVCGDPNSAMRFAFIEFREEESVLQVPPSRSTCAWSHPV